jgi:hypothetical protein
MKKYVFFIWIFSILFFSCENLNTDLPYTDIEKYRISGGFSFPKDTTAIDIYNCLLSEGFLNNSEKNLLTGSQYSIIQNAILNGVNVSNSRTRNITEIKITYTKTEPEIHEYILTLYFDDGSTDFYSNLTPQTKPETHLNCVYNYTWQRQTTNVWKNDKILGELIIKW